MEVHWFPLRLRKVPQIHVDKAVVLWDGGSAKGGCTGGGIYNVICIVVVGEFDKVEPLSIRVL